MIDRQHLKYIYNDELYLVKEEQVKKESTPLAQETTADTEKVETPSSSAWLLVAAKTLTERENELLGKILEAVGVSDEEFELEVGSTKRVTEFKKALIFFEQPVGEFYTLKNYKGTELLSARPLSVMVNSREEKMKLWTALKEWFGIS